MTPKICLTMIVRNEQKIIERCLDSVKNIVDCISICDTGSTDDTVQTIQHYLNTSGLPGKVHQHTWKDFGHNRTRSVIAAQEWLKEIGFALEDTFLLLLDADMMLEIGAHFDKQALTSDGFQLIQKNQNLSYYNTRLIRASLPWKCVGVTHEYWASQKPCREEKLHSLTIDDRNDGGCKADKFERDVRLLTQGLKDEPNNARYMFYLARSYDCLKQYEKAIEWYRQRIKMGGWLEEVWYSTYMIGRCYEELGSWDQALSHYLEAYQLNPARAESLQEISRYYRSKGQHHLAYAFAKMGARIPYPSQQVLFISHSVYQYLFDEDISISAYYTPFKEEGYAAANRLILNKLVPQHVKDQAYKNMLFYVESLRNADYHPLVNDITPLNERFSARYNPIDKVDQHVVQQHDFSRFLGSAAPVPFDNGQLMLVYETVPQDKDQRSWHRFVYFDQNPHVVRVSKPFNFLNKENEHCYGMSANETATKLMMPIAIADKEAYLCSVDFATVRAMLEPVT